MNRISLQNSLEELQKIIEYENKIYDILCEIKLLDTDAHPKKILKLTSGFGISNALYEKFSKTMMDIYCTITNSKIDYIIKYKSTSKIEMLVKELKLDLEYHFNIKKNELTLQIPIKNYNELLTCFNTSYQKRNYYLHGDFSLNENIDNNTFQEFVIEVIKLQIFTTKLLKNAFIAELTNYTLECEES